MKSNLILFILLVLLWGMLLILGVQSEAKSLSRVNFVPSCHEYLTMPNKECAAGVYDQETKEIYIDESLQEPELSFIISHEEAHYIWYNDLSEHQRRLWKYWFRKKPFYVSEYSKTSPEENFAEFYAFYLTGWGRFDNLQSRLLNNFLK